MPTLVSTHGSSLCSHLLGLHEDLLDPLEAWTDVLCGGWLLHQQLGLVEESLNMWDSCKDEQRSRGYTQVKGVYPGGL